MLDLMSNRTKGSILQFARVPDGSNAVLSEGQGPFFPQVPFGEVALLVRGGCGGVDVGEESSRASGRLEALRTFCGLTGLLQRPPVAVRKVSNELHPPHWETHIFRPQCPHL